MKIIFWILICAICFYGCSVQRHLSYSQKDMVAKGGTTNDSELTLLKASCEKSKNSWSNVVRNFSCISEINTLTKSYLVQGNSAKALKIATFGIKNYGFDGGIKASFLLSLDTFIKATNEIALENTGSCEKVTPRLVFLSAVSPDNTSFVNHRCAQHKDVLLLNRPNVLELNIPEGNVEIERKVYESVSGQIKYQIKQNLRDDRLSLLVGAVNFWKSFALQSFEIQVPKGIQSLKEKLSLSVKAKSLYKEGLNKEYCQKIKRSFEVKNGHQGKCYEYRFDRRFRNTPYTAGVKRVKVALGAKNYSFINDEKTFDHFTPKRLLVSLRFNKGGKTLKKYFYQLDDFVINDTGSGGYPYYAEYEISRNGSVVKLGDRQPHLSFPKEHCREERPGHRKCTFSFELGDVAYGELGETDSIVIAYEPYLTFLNYLTDSTDKPRLFFEAYNKAKKHQRETSKSNLILDPFESKIFDLIKKYR